MQGNSIRVYECIRGVKKVAGLQKNDLESGSNIGICLNLNLKIFEDSDVIVMVMYTLL